MDDQDHPLAASADRTAADPIGAIDAIAAVGALAEPTRRALYQFVAGRREPVARDQAAAALGIGQPVAAFHLDRLVEARLLEATYHRRSGRTGPGAGRPAKFYRRSTSSLQVTLPPRRYELAAQLFAQALLPADVEAAGPLVEAARARGRALGGGAADLLAALRLLGYEPEMDGDRIRLRNCPFFSLAQTHGPVTCAMNLGLVEGLVAGAHLGLDVSPHAAAGDCCATIGLATADLVADSPTGGVEPGPNQASGGAGA